MAQYFDKAGFLGPLAINKDMLTDVHGNSHMPIILGAAARYMPWKPEIDGGHVCFELTVQFLAM